MPSNIALLICIVLILFLLIRDIKKNPHLSNVLIIPLIYLLIFGSKNLGAWLNIGSVQSITVAEAYQEGSPLDRNFLLLVFFCNIIVLARRNLAWADIIRKNTLLLYFTLYCFISVIWTDYPFIAIKRLFKYIVMITMILVILSENSPSDAFLALMRRGSYVLVAFSLLFIKYFPQLGRYYNKWTFETGYSGVCGNKNELGVLCIIAVIIFIYELQYIWDIRKNLFTSFDTWICLIFLIMTFYLIKIADSSTAKVCSVLAGSIILSKNIPVFKRNPKKIVFWIISIFIVLVSLQLLFDIKGTIIHALGRRPDLTDRTYIWETLLKFDSNPIIGAGYESFWTLKRMLFLYTLDITVTQAHNGYIETYLNLGYIGVFFFISFFVLSFVKVKKDMSNEIGVNILRFAFLLMFALYNYTEAAFPRIGYLTFLFFLVIMTPLGNTSFKKEKYIVNQQ